MALAITLTMKRSSEEEKPPTETALSEELSLHENYKKIMPSKRISRFVALSENPRAADHCRKDNEICTAQGFQNTTCCNNKCIDLKTDENNCGACKKKCKYTEACCRGECVTLAFDKRHCGECNHRCMPGGYCIYAMCDYA